MCWAFNRQYKTQYIAAMPTNLYGPNDNYDLSTSHVLPALLRKMHEAKINGAAEVVVWEPALHAANSSTAKTWQTRVSFC